MPDPSTALPQDPGPRHHPTGPRPAGPLRSLLQLALGLTFLFGLTCAGVEAMYWWSGPSLRGTRALGESLAQGTTDPDALKSIARLRADEVYTYDQLQEVAVVLRREEWERIRREWLEDVALLLFWTGCVLLGRESWRWYQESRPAPAIHSPVGILDATGTFVPHELPFPALDRQPLATLRPPPEWLRTTLPQTALAGALLECYAAHPEWPAAPSADPSSPGRQPHGHPPGTRLLDHALAVRARALALADQRGLPAHLAELVGLGHDLGKLVTFRPEGSRYVRMLPHHDRMSAVLFAALPEWGTLLPEEQEDLATAVAFHHRRDRLPARATPRARVLLALLADADETIRFQERYPMATQGVPPRPEGAVEAPPAPAPRPEGPPAPAASTADLQQKLMQVLRGLLPALRINTSPFDGRADGSQGFAMLLGSALLAALTAQLTPAEREPLGLPGDGAIDRLLSHKDRLPHPSSPAIAGALRQLGWLIESWRGQSAALWQVKIGRRVWPVCWLLRTDAWPAELVSRWAAHTWPIEVLGPAAGYAVVDHGLAPEPSAVPGPPGVPVGEEPARSASPVPLEPHLGDGLADAAGEHEEMIHETLDAL